MRLVILVVAVMLMLAGCGGGASDGGGDDAAPVATEIDAGWSLNALELRDRVGDKVGYRCPPAGSIGNVWGTGPYTDDSSVCSAGVHAGAITLKDGGRVVIEVQEGQESYEAGSANGVDAQDWPEWPGSFIVLGTR